MKHQRPIDEVRKRPKPKKRRYSCSSFDFPTSPDFTTSLGEVSFCDKFDDKDYNPATGKPWNRPFLTLKRHARWRTLSRIFDNLQ
jgi:hypothetical protein